jgi:hypothetical protein
MDIILSSIGDIAKHIIQGQINTADKSLDIKVIGLVSVLITCLVKWLAVVLKLDFAYWRWYVYYHVFQNKCFKFPVLRSDMLSKFSSKHYYEVKMDKNGARLELIGETNIKIFYKILGHKFADHYDGCYTDPSTFNITNTDTSQKFNVNCVNGAYINRTLSTSPQYDANNDKARTVKGGYYVAHVNGYFIYLCDVRLDSIPQTYLQFECASIHTLNLFMQYLKEEAAKLESHELAGDTGYIYEPKMVNNEMTYQAIGKVKPNLTMDNYISRNKASLIKHLDAFRDNTLFGTNPYLENNLGILLHGGYGTGKSYMISAVANYLDRGICNVNFAKIKTISEFRRIMTRENCEKYVYCFDEFDYLLADILNGTQANDAKADIQFKIHTLNQQLAAVKDNKELSDAIVTEIKHMMEAGTSDILTYPALLSELSGISSVTGRIIIATTNFIDRIPAALLRPGRFDLVMELGNFNSAEIRELLCKLYKPTTEALAKLNRVTFPENKFTPSELILMSCKHPKLTDMVKALGGKFTGAKSATHKPGNGNGVSMEEVEDMCKTS